MNIPEKYKGTEIEDILNKTINKIDFVFANDHEIHSGLYTRIVIKSIIHEILYQTDENGPDKIP